MLELTIVIIVATVSADLHSYTSGKRLRVRVWGQSKMLVWWTKTKTEALIYLARLHLSGHIGDNYWQLRSRNGMYGTRGFGNVFAQNKNNQIRPRTFWISGMRWPCRQKLTSCAVPLLPCREWEVDNSSMKSRKGACLKSEDRVNIFLHLPYASHVDDDGRFIKHHVHSPVKDEIKLSHPA